MRAAMPRRTTAPTWRALRERDLDAVVALGVALYVEDPGTRPIAARDVRRTLRALQAAPVRGRCVVAVVDGVIVGYALLCGFWSNELGGEVCTIDELYVAPAARSRGLGTLLVEGLAARTWPWFRRAVALELEVTPDNDRARRLYRRLGFRPRKNDSLRMLLPAR